MKIKTKNKNYTGVMAGVTFLNGVATVNKNNISEMDIDWFVSKGCIVKDSEEKEKEEEKEKTTKKSK